jgi:S-formylglutathione hydrolase
MVSPATKTSGVPPSALKPQPAPPLIYLIASAQKGGLPWSSRERGHLRPFLDTSPRGARIEDEYEDWDFGIGAGFYLNATDPTCVEHYNALTRVTVELPQVISSDGLGIPIDLTRQSIFGHSMGDLGALTIYLASLLGLGDSTQPKQHRSVSAFAPSPTLFNLSVTQ